MLGLSSQVEPKAAASGLRDRATPWHLTLASCSAAGICSSVVCKPRAACLLRNGRLAQQRCQRHVCKGRVCVHQVHLVHLKQPLQHVGRRLEHPATQLAECQPS